MQQEIKDYLKDHNVSYATISHTPAFTASQIAQAAHIPGKHLGKSVIVKLDDKLAMVLLPAHQRLDFKRLQESTQAQKVELAHEFDFDDTFHDCELGAMPPFGELYGLDVYLADSLSHIDWVAFNAGTHDELLRLSMKDFLALVHPKLLPRC